MLTQLVSEARHRGLSLTNRALADAWASDVMAERVGFEPTERFPAHSISSAANSTTLAPLRKARMKDEGGRMNSAKILLLHLVLGAFNYSNQDLRKLECFRLQRCQASR